jgi:hypothetical protein
MRRTTTLLLYAFATLSIGSANARNSDISENTLVMTSIADATVSAERCGFALNSDQIMADMLASPETFDAFSTSGYKDDLDAAEVTAKTDRDAFCWKAMADYGPDGNKFKNLLRPQSTPAPKAVGAGAHKSQW